MRLFSYLILILAFFGYSEASDNLQKQILLAKNKVFPALVHIEPVKEVFEDGKRVKIQVTGDTGRTTNAGDNRALVRIIPEVQDCFDKCVFNPSDPATGAPDVRHHLGPEHFSIRMITNIHIQLPFQKTINNDS